RVRVEQLVARKRARTRGSGGIDHRAHRDAAFLREAEQHAELLGPIVSRHDEDRVGAGLAEALPQALELRERELRRAERLREPARPGLEVEAGPEAVARVARLQPRGPQRLAAGRDAAAVDDGEAGLDRTHALGARDHEPGVVDLD